jgi:hypothetical protein
LGAAKKSKNIRRYYVSPLRDVGMFSVSGRRPLSIKMWFLAVGAIGAVSALVIGGLAAWYSWDQQKLRLGQNLMATSRALIQSSDRELDQAAVALRGLAGSSLCNEGRAPRVIGAR